MRPEAGSSNRARLSTKVEMASLILDIDASNPLLRLSESFQAEAVVRTGLTDNVDRRLRRCQCTGLDRLTFAPSKYLTIGLIIAVLSGQYYASAASQGIHFVPPPKWQRAPKNSFTFPGVLDVWFSPTHSATTFRPNINLRFVNLAGSAASLDSIVTDSLTSMRERDPTLEVLERRDNLRCRRGASERIDLRLLATDGSSQTFEMVATRVQGGVYIAAYARSTRGRAGTGSSEIS
jgi:hypothetical protein